MLLYYFPDKAAVLSAALDCAAERLQAHLAGADWSPLPPDRAWPRLAAAATDPAVWPYMQLWLDIVAQSARGDPFWRDRGKALGLAFGAWVAAGISAPTPEDRAAEAEVLFQRLEGLILLRAVGLSGPG